MGEAPATSWFASRPAFPAAIALSIGIAAYRLLPATPGVWMFLAILLGCLDAWLISRQRSAAVCLMAAISLSGAASAQLAVYFFPADHIGSFATDEPRLAALEVRVDSPVRVIESESGKHIPPRLEFTAEVRRIGAWSGWENASGQLLVSIEQTPAGVQQGAELQLIGTLQRPLSASNPGQFDWALYDRRQRLLAELHVQHASGVRILMGGSKPIFTRARERARAALESGFSSSNRVEQELLTALVLGDRGADLQDVEEAFRHTGDTHLLASNGLRIGVLAAGVYVLCLLGRLSPRKSVWTVTLAVAFFGLLTTAAPQTLRPVLLCVAVGIIIASGRRTDSVQLLSLAALAVLVVSPLDFFAAGFQLGFATVLGLMLFAGPVSSWMREWEDPDRAAAGDLLRTSRRQRFRVALWAHFRPALAAASVAWIVAAPLVAFHFEQFNPWSIPIAALLSPLVFICMIAGFLKMAMTLAIPHLASQWSLLASAPTSLLNHAVSQLAKIPGDDLPIASPPVAIILAAYLLICLPAIARLPLFNRLRRPWMSRPTLRWLGRCAPAALALVLLVAPARQSARATDGTLQVTLLSVGAGQTAVVELPDGRALLFDCGSSTLSDDMRQCLAPFLRHEGRSHVDAIWLSHGDFDHISAAAAAATEYGVRDVMISPNFRAHARESATAEGLLETLGDLHVVPQVLWTGQHIDLGDGATLDVLWPPQASTLNSNNGALVLRLAYAGRSILFPADIQAPAELALLQHPAALAADVLVAPHHGSREESTSDFISAVHPRFIVSSNADHLTQKQRAFDQLADSHPLYRTSKCGALMVTIGKDGNLNVRGFLRLREEGETRMTKPESPNQ